MEQEEKVSKKMMISCREASMLSVISEYEKISVWQKIQLKFHNIMCEVCKLFHQQSAEINRLIKNAFAEGKHKMKEEKKAEIEKELNKLYS